MTTEKKRGARRFIKKHSTMSYFKNLRDNNLCWACGEELTHDNSIDLRDWVCHDCERDAIHNATISIEKIDDAILCRAAVYCL